MNIVDPCARIARTLAWRSVVVASGLIALVASVTAVSAMSTDVPETTLASIQASDTNLLSNLSQVAAPEGWEAVGPDDHIVRAQALNFTTGSNEDGYSISQVIAWLKDVDSNDSPQVSIYEVDNYGNPAEILYTLTNPGSFTNDARNTFTASANAVLAKSTEYALVFENAADVESTVFYQVGFVASNSLDANGASGWSIGTEEDYTVLFKISGALVSSYDDLRRGPDQPGSDTVKSTVVTVPASLTVKRDDKRLTVEWSAATDDGAKSLTGYRVQWKGQGGNWSGASEAEVATGSQAYTITGLVNGNTYNVRVAAEYDGSPGTWSSVTDGSPQVVAGDPKDLNVRGLHDRLKVSWKRPDNSKGHTTTGYLVEWKSGSQSYDTGRQQLVAAPSSSDAPLTIRGVEDDVVNVVRVSTMSDDTVVGMSVMSAVPVSARAYIAGKIVPKFEGDFPWVRDAWSNRPLYVRVRGSGGPGFYVFSYGGRGFHGLPRGIRVSFNLPGYRSDTVVLHELAHHYTLDHRVHDNDSAVGVGWLYFNHRVKGHCSVGEIYADVITYVTRGKPSPGLGYLWGCRQIASKGRPDAESREVVISLLSGHIPDWYEEHYDDGDGNVDLEAVWDDVRNAGSKRLVAYLLRDMHGGFCSLGEAAWALGSAGAVVDHPWSDGGCHSRKPQNMAIVTRNGALKVTWEPHLYEAGPSVTHYLVQWRTGDQEFDASRQALVADNGELSHTIEGLADGVQHFVRVVAVNSNSPTVHDDNDGHSRAAAKSATPGKPAAPANLAVTGADHEIQISWEEPTGSEIELSGYRVDWKTGSEAFDATRQLDLTNASTTSAVIPNLLNAVFYTVRVRAISHDGTIGAPAWKTVATQGPPEAPTNVTAVGGRNSLLVSWGLPEGGTIHDAFVVQWRTSATYEPGDEVTVWRPGAGAHLLEDMAGHGRYYVRVLARNVLGRSQPSDEYYAMSGAPHPPADFQAQVRPAGGYTVTWDRPQPYYPDNPDFRPVRNFKTKKPIRDANGNTVPQYRYDVEYKRADGQPEGWCVQDEYRNFGVGNDTLSREPLTLDVSHYCAGAAPVLGQTYNFRIRASYVWKNSGDTNVRNGEWTYSGPVRYELPGGPPNPPSSIEAVGGKESLLVSWEPPDGGGIVGGYIVQWRTGATYDNDNKAIVSDPAAVSHLLKNMAGHGRYHVRVKAFNINGESTATDEFFVMSGAPGKPTQVRAEARPGGGFHLTWDRPDPYYPNNPDYKPVRPNSTSSPILDADGNTVPQFRYDVEYRLAGDEPGPWCSKDKYRNLHRGYDTLDPAVHQLDYTDACQNARWVVGQQYNFRIRAAYVWLNSGDTNKRNGPWQSSGRVTYDLTGGVPGTPPSIEAAGGRDSLLVSWDRPFDGGPIGGYIVQWRTGENYQNGDKAVVADPDARSRLLERMAGHGRYYVRVKTYNILGESAPSGEYFVMSGAPGVLTDYGASVRQDGGFTLTWDRPDPYYPNNPDFRPVRNFNTKKPKLDSDGNTVPQYRYDVEYKLADGQPGGWCSQDRYRNFGVGNDTLNSDALTLDLTRYCSGAEPVAGETYNFRIRASYVWRKSGDTNPRNGPWAYSGPVEYNPGEHDQN